MPPLKRKNRLCPLPSLEKYVLLAFCPDVSFLIWVREDMGIWAVGKGFWFSQECDGERY